MWNNQEVLLSPFNEEPPNVRAAAAKLVVAFLGVSMARELKEDKAREILEETEPKTALGKVKSNDFVFEVQVDTTPQELRKIRPYKTLMLRVPPDMPTYAWEVLRRLFRCFTKAGHVSEGLVADLCIGFGTDTHEEKPLFPGFCLEGLKQLHLQGYVKFAYRDGAGASPQDDNLGEAFVKYTPKFLGMLYDN